MGYLTDDWRKDRISYLQMAEERWDILQMTGERIGYLTYI